MSNAARNRPRSPKAVAAERPFWELKFTARIAPPDGPRDPATDEPLPVELDVDLLRFTISERQLAKRAMAKLVDPDATEVILVHAWVVWRRTNPTSSLQLWFDNLNLGDVIEAATVEPGHVLWDTTPEHYDPEA